MPGQRTIWSVGGGKGGVGKSVTAANLGCVLARMGRRVMLVDADLGGANLHTYFGIKYPPTGLEDFLRGRAASLDAVAVPAVPPNLRLICGAGEFLGIANPAHSQKQKLIRHIKDLDAEFIIVDLGAGSSYNVLDFFAISNEGIIVLVPEPAAIQNAYIFLKSFVYRRLTRIFSSNPVVSAMVKDATDAKSAGSVKSFSDLCERIAAVDIAAAEAAVSEIRSYRPKLILNMAASKEDMRVVDAFMGAAKTFLGIEAQPAGVLYSRPSVKAAARRMRPFMLDPAAAEAHADMELIVSNLLSTPAPGAAKEAAAPAPQARPEGGGAKQEVFGFNDNVPHQGTVFHVQTEVQGGGEPFIETIIYNGGRIFFSKRTAWRDAGGNGSIRDFAQRQHRAAMAAVKMDKISLQGQT